METCSRILRTGVAALLLCTGAVRGQVSIEQDINRQGSDYKSFTTGGQPEACRQACADDQNCQSYTWLPVDKNQGLCWLKNAVQQPTAHATWVSGVKSQVSMELDTNRQSLDYKNFTTAGQSDECRQACANDQNCQAYTWVPLAKNQGLCWLKNAVPRPIGQATWVSGVKSFSGAWPQPQGQDTLGPGETLVPGGYLLSNNGRWKLEFRDSDGNMVLYNTATGDTDNGRFFGTDTGNIMLGKAPSPVYPLHHVASESPLVGLLFVHFCLMRNDGNFVMFQGETGSYDPNGNTGPIVFQSGTSGHAGAFLKVEDDGNVVILDPSVANYVIWHRGLFPW